jgi:UDP:flavonoid glycosyltransferase YjiC (YdhE family)
MTRKHIAFCLEQAYGHLIPTFGIALELKKRGHKVSYAVNANLAPMIQRLDVVPLVFDPLPEDRAKAISEIVSDSDCLSYKVGKADVPIVFQKSLLERTAHSLPQLERLFFDDRPDVIIHDDCSDTAGRELALKWNLPKIRHHSQFLDEGSPIYSLDDFDQDELILLTIPEFFQRDRSFLDSRFVFVGFVPEGRDVAFERWEHRGAVKGYVLISATTGLIPQLEFCRIMIDAFRKHPIEVVLSISGSRDTASAINPDQLGDMLTHIHLNTVDSNFQLLKDACLFIGQGGQGASLESIFRGVRQLVVPPTPYHYAVGRRVAELGLGVCMHPSQLSADSVFSSVMRLLDDQESLTKVKSASALMQMHHGALLAADLIERYPF